MATVEIKLNNGDLSYEPCCPQVERGEELKWICHAGDFGVHIGRNSPLPKGRYRQANGNPTGDDVLPNARPGEYKYFVAVHDGTNIWTDDPIFIVKRP